MKLSETDSTFLNRLNTRDYTAFKQLFREYFQDLAYYSGKILKNMHVAEDIAQEVFVHLWEKENHFENHLALKSYLYLSARNSCLNYIKHHHIVTVHAQTVNQEEADDYTWDLITETEIISLLSDYIRQLPEECSRIMLLVMQGYNSTEISALTGASSSTVRSQKQRGITLLKKMISPELYTFLLLFTRKDS